MIFKFCTDIRYDKLYCVTKNQPHMAYQSLCLSNFLSYELFHHISSASMSARVIKFCIHDKDNQVYCYKQNENAVIYICVLFLFFLFVYLLLKCNEYGNFCHRFLKNYLTLSIEI